MHMRRPVWVAVVVLCALTLGCSSSSDPDAEVSESPLRFDPPSDPAPPVAMKYAPEKGTCWLAPKRAFAPDFWFDDLSRQVPCNEPHTTETVSAVEVDTPTTREAEQWADWCWDSVNSYLNVSTEHWVPWLPLLYLPSREQIADGASWVRCDAALPGHWDFTTMRTVDFPLHNAASERRVQLQACLDQHPRIVDQPFVDCTGPHAYESTGQVAAIDGLTSYPSPATRRKEASQCRAGLPPEQSSAEFAAVAVWDAKEQLRDGVLWGVCFVHRADGAPLR